MVYVIYSFNISSKVSSQPFMETFKQILRRTDVRVIRTYNLVSILIRYQLFMTPDTFLKLCILVYSSFQCNLLTINDCNNSPVGNSGKVHWQSSKPWPHFYFVCYHSSHCYSFRSTATSPVWGIAIHAEKGISSEPHKTVSWKTGNTQMDLVEANRWTTHPIRF